MAEAGTAAPKGAGLSTAVADVAGPSSSAGAGAVPMHHVVFAGRGGDDASFGGAGDDVQLLSHGDDGIDGGRDATHVMFASGSDDDGSLQGEEVVDTDTGAVFDTSSEHFVFLSLDSDGIEEFQAGDRIDLGALYGLGGIPATVYVGDFTAAGQLKLSIVDGGMPVEGNDVGSADFDATIMFVNPFTGSDLE